MSSGLQYQRIGGFLALTMNRSKECNFLWTVNACEYPDGRSRSIAEQIEDPREALDALFNSRAPIFQNGQGT